MPTTATSLTATPPYDHTIRSGDALPLFVCTLSDPAGNPVVLTGCTVAFKMRNAITKATVTLTGAATIVAPTDGTVQFAFTAADSNQFGLYEGLWVVTQTIGGLTESFPNDHFLQINITRGL